MRVLRVILVLSIISFVKSESSDTNNVTEFRAADYVNPSKYQLHYNFDYVGSFEQCNGSVLIQFISKRDTDYLELNYDGGVEEINFIRLTNVNTSDEIQNFEIKNDLDWTHKICLVSETNFVTKDVQYEIMIEFNSNLDAKSSLKLGLYEFKNGRKLPIVHSGSSKNKNAFPVFDDDTHTMMSKFKLSITHNRSLTAVSNTPSIRLDGNDKNMVTTKFDETPIISLQSFGFAISEFRARRIGNNSNLPITIYGIDDNFDGNEMFIEFAGRITDEFQNYLKLGIKTKLDIVTIPQMKYATDTKLGMVLCDSIIIQDFFDGSKQTISMFAIGKTIADHILGDYFGRNVSEFSWIKDGLSSYLTFKFSEKLAPPIGGIFKVLVLHHALMREHFKVDSTLDDPKNSRLEILYPKSVAIFEMINNMLGGDKFQHILVKSIKNRTDLIASFNTAFDGAPNLIELIKLYTSVRGYPALNLTQNNGTAQFEISQTSYGVSDVRDKVQRKWLVPYNFASKSKPNFNETNFDGWSNETNKILTLNAEPGDWIIGNKQCLGYYLVMYDEPMWNKIIDELINGDMELIHPINRAFLLTTAYIASISNELQDSVFFNLLTYLKRETDPRPWLIADEIFDAIHKKLNKIDSKYLSQLNEVMGLITGQLYDRLDLNLTRLVAMKWACYSGHQACLDDFERQSNDYLKSAERNKPMLISADVKDLMLCYGFRNETNYRKLFSTSNDSVAHDLFKNRIDCHIHTNFFRIKFIKMYMFNDFGTDPMGSHLLMMYIDRSPMAIKAIPQLIFDSFEKNLDVFDAEYGKIRRKSPFSLIGSMLRTNTGNMDMKKFDSTIQLVRKKYGDAEANEILKFIGR